MERVYEIGRVFRNEGLDTRHNPEFTLMELYQAYTDYHGMMDLTENLYRYIAKEVTGSEILTYGEHTMDLSKPFERITMVDAVQKKTLFQKQACVTCRLSNVEPIHARIETLKSKTFEVVTSRAFASLKDMVELTRDVLAEDGRWLAMKGKFPEQEIEELPPDVEVEKKQLLTLEKGKIERVLIVLKRKVA